MRIVILAIKSALQGQRYPVDTGLDQIEFSYPCENDTEAASQVGPEPRQISGAASMRFFAGQPLHWRVLAYYSNVQKGVVNCTRGSVWRDVNKVCEAPTPFCAIGEKCISDRSMQRHFASSACVLRYIDNQKQVDALH